MLRQLRSRFLRDTATLQVGAVINAASNLASAIALAHVLGAGDQGRFYVAVAMYSLVWTVLNQGLFSATVSQVAAGAARGIEVKVAAWLAFLAKAHLLLGAGLFAAGWWLFPWIAVRVLHADPELGAWARWLALTPLLEVPRMVACAGLQGSRRMLAFTQIENGQEVVRMFLVVLGAIVTDSPAGAVAGMLGASAFGTVISVEVYRRGRREGAGPLPSVRAIARQVRDVPLRQGLSLGFKLGLVRMVTTLGMQVLPSLFLQRFGTSQWVAYLRIAQSFLRLPMMLMQGISRTALPALSELAGLRDMERFRRTFWRASLLGGATISAGLLVFIPLIPGVLSLFFPSDYRDPVTLLCWILVPGFVVMSFSIANDIFYLLINRLRAATWICLASLVLNVAVVGVLTWRYPQTGAAWGLSFSMATTVVHHLYAALYFRRHARETAARAGVVAP